MAQTYQKRFWFNFKDVKNVQHTVEIWKLAEPTTVTAVEVRGDENPFTISMPNISDKFQSVRGTGCQINLLSQTNMQFLELYTAFMFEYQIRAYKNAQLIWTGYLDSELYTEPLDSLRNYPVSFSGSDGFALLDRLLYVDASGKNYSGLTTQYDIFKNIMQKLSLPYSAYYIGIATSIAGVTPATSETVFHKTFVLNSNYYDEDGKAFTLRKVLEAILAPYGAFIIQDLKTASIVITDVHSLVNATTIPIKTYNTSFTYVASPTTINTVIGDLSTIDFADINQTLNIIGGYNKEVVKYSPYRQLELEKYDSNFTIPVIANDSEVNTYHDYGTTNWTWREYFYDKNKSFTRVPHVGYNIKMFGTGAYNLDRNDSYIKRVGGINNYNYSPANVWDKGTKSFSFTGNTDIVINNSNINKYALKIEMSVFPRQLNNLGDLGETIANSSRVDQCFVHCDVIIGTKHYTTVYNTSSGIWGGKWESTATGFTSLMISEKSNPSAVEYAVMNDNWTDLKVQTVFWNGKAQDYLNTDFLLPLNTIQNGKLIFNINAYTCYQNNAGVWTWTDCQDFRMKNINITLVNYDGSDIENNDTEYIGYMNAQYANEGDTMELVQGTNVDSCPVERGGLICYTGSTYAFIQNWTRAGKTDVIENLLLRSYVGNYENKTIELSCSTNLLSTGIGYITYNNYFTGKKFMVTSLENNYADAISTISMQEIFIDALDINKTY